MANLTDTEEGRAMLAHVEQQIERMQRQKPQHIVNRYGKLPRLPRYPVKLVLPTIPEKL
jgi:hypothetical protein